MNSSAFAHLRQHLREEHEAAHQGLSGLAQIASHRSITARMERAWSRVQTLRAVGCEQQAQALLTSDDFYEPMTEEDL
jgi:hypothetical protein